MTPLARPRPLDPRTRPGRLRATAGVGGLAVLLGGSVGGHQPAGTPITSATGGLAVLTGATAHVGAVARTGGQP